MKPTPNPVANHTFFWHDYETFGLSPRTDRPAQFAGIRTDAALNEIGEPVMLYCQPQADYVPSAMSSLITGITPQICAARGVPEAQFAARIEAELSATGTVGVGYNTIRFDDEFTRFMLWRNLHDPYAREWKNQCGRWDLLDVVRATYALRPEGIAWPMVTDEKTGNPRPSFKLEDLTRANGIEHAAAHDALSDVRATIAIARLIRTAQPRLFDFCFALHKKDRVWEEMGWHGDATAARAPFLHVSGQFGAERGNIALMYPLAVHPTNKNEVIAWDLSAKFDSLQNQTITNDPRELLSMTAEDVQRRMFTKVAELPEGETRLPIKTIHVNKSPIIVKSLKALTAAQAEKFGIDIEAALAAAIFADELRDPAAVAKLSELWSAVFNRTFEPNPEADADIDQGLYSIGFLHNDDRATLNQLRLLSPAALAKATPQFKNEALHEMVFRYRARNFPETLNDPEQDAWQERCAAVVHEESESKGGVRSVAGLMQEIETLRNGENQGKGQGKGQDKSQFGELNEKQAAVLDELEDYAMGLG